MKKINKLLSITSLFLMLFCFNAFSEVVTKVDVTGNSRISKETIIIFGDIEIGKNYEKKDLNTIIKKLYDTTFFANLNLSLENGTLKITVEENPIINSIVFNGEKAKKFKEAISKNLNLKEKTSFIRNYVKSDINLLKEFYRQLGFYFVKIEAEVEKITKNRVNIIYTIEKGKKAKISKIYFLGDKKIRDNRLRDIVTSQEAKFWKFISKNVYLNKERVDLDKRLLKNYFRNQGYYEAEISSSNVEYSEGEGFVLTFNINAGTRYKFKKIVADIDPALDKIAFKPLEKEFNKVVGEYYSANKLTKILEKIDKLSEQKELQFINHSVDETLDASGVDVKINIFEGQKFTIERINIIGNSVTNDSVIRGELDVDEGDPYSVLLVNRSINKLKARKIFGNVEKIVTAGSSPDLKVIEISVEERATGEISAGAGVGTQGTSFLFAVKENNWLGRGIKLQSSLDITEETIGGNVSLINPNHNFTGNALFASLDVSSEDRTTNSGYKSSKTGVSFGTEFEQYENIFLAPAISASHENLTTDSTASASLKKMEGNFHNLDFDYGITWDHRNQVFQPTSGYVTRFKQTLPIIQDSSAITNGLEISKYHGFSEDVIGAIKFMGRAINGVDEDVRLTSRLFIPANRLRGFNTRKVGPKDGDDYIGGNYTSALSFEAQLPNLLPESTNTDVSVFIDSANVWSVDYNSSLDESNTIRSAFGVSANVYTTIGPLSLTLAQDITKGTHDETQAFNFRLGTSF